MWSWRVACGRFCEAAYTAVPDKPCMRARYRGLMWEAHWACTPLSQSQMTKYVWRIAHWQETGITDWEKGCASDYWHSVNNVGGTRWASARWMLRCYLIILDRTWIVPVAWDFGVCMGYGIMILYYNCSEALQDKGPERARSRLEYIQ